MNMASCVFQNHPQTFQPASVASTAPNTFTIPPPIHLVPRPTVGTASHQFRYPHNITGARDQTDYMSRGYYPLQQQYNSYIQQNDRFQQFTNSSANFRNVENVNASQAHFNSYQPIYNERPGSNCENLSPVSLHSSNQSPAPVSTDGLTQLATPTPGQLVQANNASAYALAPLITPIPGNTFPTGFKNNESHYLPSINLNQKRKPDLLSAGNGEFSVPTAKKQRQSESLEDLKSFAKTNIYRIWNRAFKYYPFLKEKVTLSARAQYVCVPDDICELIFKHEKDETMKEVIELYLRQKKVICCELNKLNCKICDTHLYKTPDKISLESNKTYAQCNSVPLKEYSGKYFNIKHPQDLAPLPATYPYQSKGGQALKEKCQAVENVTCFGLKAKDFDSLGSGMAEGCNQDKVIRNSSMALRDPTQFTPQNWPSSPSPRPLTHRQQAANMMKLPEKATKRPPPKPKRRTRKKKKTTLDGAEQPVPDISCFNLQKTDKSCTDGSDEKINENNTHPEKGLGGMALPVTAECITISDDEECYTPIKQPEVNISATNDADEEKVTFEAFVFVDGDDDLERTSAEFGLEEVKRMTLGT